MKPMLHAGGALSTAHAYLPRDADQSLLRALLSMEYAYVLAPRKCGKSSLSIRTQQALREYGHRCVSIDLSMLGASDATAEEWYSALVFELGAQLGMQRAELQSWWTTEQPSLSSLQRFVRFVGEYVIDKTASVTIFLDEIDSLLSAQRHDPDDFFCAIRGFYNLRATNARFQKLTFCLLGVVSIQDLIRDARRTPFNIGEAIDLRDFSRGQLAALETYLRFVADDAVGVLDRVFALTSGHPYMTQKLCLELCRRGPSEPRVTAEDVESIAAHIFPKRIGHVDPVFVRTEQLMLRARSPEHFALRLGLYQQVLHDTSVTVSPSDRTAAELRIAGLVTDINTTTSSRLVVRNELFRRYFDRQWVERMQPQAPVSGQQAKALPTVDAIRQTGWLPRPLKSALSVAAAITALALSILAALRPGSVSQDTRTALTVVNPVARPHPVQLNAPPWKRVADLSVPSPGTPEWSATAREEDSSVAVDRLRNTKTHRQEHSRGVVPPSEVTPSAASTDLGGSWLSQECGRHIELRPSPEVAAARLVASIQQASLLDDSLTWSTAQYRGALFTAIQQAIAGQPLVRLGDRSDGVSTVAFSPRGDRLLSLHYDGSARLWSLHDGRERLLLKNRGELLSGGTDQSGERLLVGESEGLLTVLSLSSGSAIWSLKGWALSQNTALLSPDGTRVFGRDEDGELSLWSIDPRPARISLREKSSPIRATFSHHGQAVAAITRDGVATVWDLVTGAQRFRVGGHNNSGTVAFTPDGQFIATASLGNAAALWRVRDSQLVHRFSGHHQWVRDIAISDDGRLLVTASADTTARVWRIDNGHMSAVLSAHPAEAKFATFSPDASLIAILAEDRSVVIFSASDGTQLAELPGRLDTAVRPRFSPDGAWLATGEPSGRIVVHPTSPRTLVRCACNLLKTRPEYEAVDAVCKANAP